MQKKSSIHPSKYWIYYAIKLSCKKDDDDCLMIFTTSFPLKTRITLSTTTTAAIHCYLAIAPHLHPTDSIRIFFFFWWWKNKERNERKSKYIFISQKKKCEFHLCCVEWNQPNETKTTTTTTWHEWEKKMKFNTP